MIFIYTHSADTQANNNYLNKILSLSPATSQVNSSMIQYNTRKMQEQQLTRRERSRNGFIENYLPKLDSTIATHLKILSDGYVL